MGISIAIALKGSQVVVISQLVPQLLEDGPIALLPLVAHRLLDVAHEIRQDAVVVQQGVVGVEKEGNGMLHGGLGSLRGREFPSPAGAAKVTTNRGGSGGA